MYIDFTRPTARWEYFLAIESDLQALTTCITFAEDNYGTYSSELTKIIITACSEIDVVVSLMTKELGLTKKKPNFGDHRPVLFKSANTLFTEDIVVKRFNLLLQPFHSWSDDQELVWHKNYNDLKHHRDSSFKQGSLGNALVSVSALFTLLVHYYQLRVSQESKRTIRLSDVNMSLEPYSSLFLFNRGIHHVHNIN